MDKTESTPSGLAVSADSTSVKPPVWFYVLGALALLWNLMGLAVFGLMLSMTSDPDTLSTMFEGDEAKIELFNNTPVWVNIAFGVAVVFGVLASLALLLRRKAALALFVISLVGVLVQNTYVFFMSNSVEVMGYGLAPMVIAIAIVMIPFVGFCSARGWLR